MDFEDSSLDEEMNNPNLYVTLAESSAGGYLLQEDGTVLTIQSGDYLFY